MSDVPELLQLPELTLDQFIDSFPGFSAAFASEERLESFCEYSQIGQIYEISRIFLLRGNATVDEEWFVPLPADAYLVVDGHLTINGRARQLLYVTGDLHCTTINIGNGPPVIGGRLFASSYVSLPIEDHGYTRDDVVSLRIVTPLLFVSFYAVDRLDIAPATLIFILADGDYCQRLHLPNPILFWHEGIHALRPELQSRVYWGSDAPCWDLRLIRNACMAGEPILREGFDAGALALCAAAAAKMGDPRSAFLDYKRVVRIAPNYGPAWLGMAEALWTVGAYEQALSHFERAATLFPAVQTGILNEGLNGAAFCALRCRRLPLAVDLASRSIIHNESATGETEFRASAYRVRAEARLLLGDMIGARADLESALAFDADHGSANWLMGLIHHLHGDAALAQAALQRAARRSEQFKVPFDSQTNTDFLSSPAATVSWDDDFIEGTLPAKGEV